MKKQVDKRVDTNLEGFHKRLADIEFKSGGPGTREGKLAETLSLSSASAITDVDHDENPQRADRRIREQRGADDLSLVPHAHELKGNQEEPGSNVDGL
jgi:hypothetical protein